MFLSGAKVRCIGPDLQPLESDPTRFVFSCGKQVLLPACRFAAVVCFPARKIKLRQLGVFSDKVKAVSSALSETWTLFATIKHVPEDFLDFNIVA